MSLPPRSQRLMAYHWAAAGYSSVWQSPGGHITLVKNVNVFNEHAAQIDFVLLARAAETSFATNLIHHTVEAGMPLDVNGSWVLNPGDVMWAWVSVAPADIWISGSILSGAPQFAPASARLLDFLPMAIALPAE